MNLASSALEDMILPGLEDAWDLSLHALACIEEGTHGIDQIVKLFKFLHELFLWQKFDLRLNVADLRHTLGIFVCHLTIVNNLDKCFKIKHSAHMTIHQARDALNLVA